MSDIDDLVVVFDTMKRAGVDTTEDLLWSFYFIDSDPEKLASVIPDLEKSGYRPVGIFEAETDDEDATEEFFFLQVEKVETHTIDSLHLRIQELRKFAEEAGLNSYDGWDVGRPDGGALIDLAE